MTIREEMEQREHMLLSPYAAFSDQSAGRERPEEQCDIRPVFQRDRDRILHSKAFRRLKNKTQVFLTPKGDHYRTRMSHTLEVSQNARTIAKALRLNEDLAEAIALGHDLGHAPFGHAGEYMLNGLCEGGFRHNVQSVRVVEKLEKHGKGLNLTWEVRDGILNHQMDSLPATLEGRIVRLSDKIAYINHDVDDAIRAKILCEEDIPAQFREVLGDGVRMRLNTLIHNIVRNSMGRGGIFLSPEVEQAMKGLRQYMFDHLYHNEIAKSEEKKAEGVLERLFFLYTKQPERMPRQYTDMIDAGIKRDRAVCDYIAGMTDQYAIAKFEEYFVPVQWQV